MAQNVCHFSTAHLLFTAALGHLVTWLGPTNQFLPNFSQVSQVIDFHSILPHSGLELILKRAGAAEPEPENWHSQEHQDSRFVGSAGASVLHCLEKLLKSMNIYEIL